MGNSTLTSLTLSSFFRGPVLSPSSSSHSNSFIFLHSLPSADFPSFLSQSLFLSSTLTLAKEKISSRQSYSTTDIAIDCCRFIKIREGGIGGAFKASVPVKLFNSYFEKCEAFQGGAIFSDNHIEMDSVSFYSCRARGSGALDMRGGNSPDLSISRCVFLKERADLFGVLFRMSKGGFVINSCNVTRPRADNCVGAIEAKFGSMEMRFTILTGASAHAHNGAMCLRMLDELTIEFCEFSNISHCSDDYESAAVMLSYENAYDSVLFHCAFLWNQPNATYTVNVLGGHILLIHGCCFTGKQEKEVAPRLARFVQSQFGQEGCPPVPLRSLVGDGPIGFVGERNETFEITQPPETVSATRNPGFEPVVVDVEGQQRVKIAFSLATALLVAAALTGVQAVIRNRRNEAGKDAKAIL